MKPTEPITLAFNDITKAMVQGFRDVSVAFEECSRQFATKGLSIDVNLAYQMKRVHAGGICGPVWHDGDIIQ